MVAAAAVAVAARTAVSWTHNGRETKDERHPEHSTGCRGGIVGRGSGLTAGETYITSLVHMWRRGQKRPRKPRMLWPPRCIRRAPNSIYTHIRIVHTADTEMSRRIEKNKKKRTPWRRRWKGKIEFAADFMNATVHAGVILLRVPGDDSFDRPRHHKLYVRRARI